MRSKPSRTPSRVLPGFGLSLGFTVLYLGIIVLLPLAALVVRSFSTSPAEFLQIVTSTRVLAAYRLSFGCAVLAAATNCVLGLIVAWVLVRYSIPGKRVLDALIDLPFALPTAVAGIALTALLVPQGWVGAVFSPLGIQIAFAPIGIFIALLFVSFPFVVRTVQPVLAELDPELEQAALSLGASRATVFVRVILPALRPSLLTGFSLGFARALGEYGSVVFIAGNMPFRTEIVPLLIMVQLDQFNVKAASAISVVMLCASFLVLLAVNLIQSRSALRRGGAK